MGGTGGIDVLLVEDNHGDVRMIEMAFEQIDVDQVLHTVKTGDEALDWLFQRGDAADSPRPALVLLDLNLPGTSGLDVLEAIKSDETLRRIPVVVLTSSQSDDDVQRAYMAHANACLIKPVDPSEFISLVQTVADFWLATAVLPRVPTADER